MARAVSGGRTPNLGALGRTINVLHSINSLNGVSTNFSSGGVPPIAQVGTVNGVTTALAFPLGSTGPDGITNNSGIARPHLFFVPFAALRDQYCAQSMMIELVRPTVAHVNPCAVWEMEADLMLRLPAGAIAGDLGMILHGDTAVTGWGTDFASAGGAVGIGRFGVGLVAMGADNQLHCVARSTVGGAITLDIPTGIIAQPPGGADRFRRLKIRLESATVSSDAKCTWFVDDVAVATRNFLASANMPNASMIPPAGAVSWLGGFRGFLRNSNNAVSGAVCSYAHWRVSAAPSVAAMGR